ncbi:MAG: RluA family pseudouridine synthase [Leptospiraceae bacterium]|nr:RluA family pseudouridine synthase [Leptospiraceae bacterium]MCP5500033.1 RluA family pseudouridine synthase [Leptospiraceae bacterium]
MKETINGVPVFKTHIKPEEAGKQLNEYLAGRFTYYTKEVWEEKISLNRILVSGEYADPSYLLQAGDSLSFFTEDFYEPEVDQNFHILFEDEFFFAVEKSGNLPVHPAGRYQEHNLLTVLKKAGKESLYIINRLDRETSGLVLFAKQKEYTHKFSSLFGDRKVEKTYIVYVHGDFPDEYLARGYLQTDTQSKIRKKQTFSEISEEGVFSETFFQKIGYGKGISKVLAFPKTGRLHQIRASLHSIGFPVYGDKIYGKSEQVFLEFIQKGEDIFKEDWISELCPGKRQALHAHKLSFVHPFTKGAILLESPEPEDMKGILDRS